MKVVAPQAMMNERVIWNNVAAKLECVVVTGMLLVRPRSRGGEGHESKRGGDKQSFSHRWFLAEN
jgi:hypothetical protein